ncbi:unnamed protein product [Zymoseptoria tritici ST99CH_3D7]|uniref:Methyltransferase type 12 domain-containing protein n=1 Tax=Zymoseptoria tritici (strain ST99CH_3D7) TaxID=1276538 RepID=A0A1X7S145_ZYMT9|nr:unnamed protein product [Zymoseptoria tritici ST99CH_3D7]
MPERSGFQYASFDWESYMRFRPAYPPKVYSTVYDHHKANGGSFNSAVDIGAGIGIVSAELVKKFSHVTVTDPSAEYVEAAKAFLAANPKEKVSFLQAKAEDLSTANLPGGGKVDLVAAAASIHWADAEVAVPRIADILNPGGTFAAWLYGTRLIFDCGENLDAVRAAYYTLWDDMVLARKSAYHTDALNATACRYDHLRFPTDTWTSVRRIHVSPDHLFTQPVGEGFPSHVTADQSVETFDDEKMISREADYEWVEGFLWSLMPDVNLKEFVPERFAALKEAMGGRTYGVRWAFVLVLATRK